jgi:hypothetical protein
MAQHDMIIDNQTFPAFRSDLNNALQALAGSNIGASPPSVTYAGQLWANTSDGVLWVRNAANAAWIAIGEFNVANMGLAKLASPQFTGAPTAPTPPLNNSSTQLATTEFLVNATVQGGARLTVRGATLQWGTSVLTTNAGGDGNIVFPVVFGAAPWFVTVAMGDPTVVFNGFPVYVQPYPAGSTNQPTATAFNFNVKRMSDGTNHASSSVRINWLAIGQTP